MHLEDGYLMKLTCALVFACLSVFYSIHAAQATELNVIHGKKISIPSNEINNLECRFSDWNNQFTWPYATDGCSGFIELRPHISGTSAGSYPEDIDLRTREVFPPAPEPMTLLLIGAGLISLATFRKRLR